MRPLPLLHPLQHDGTTRRRRMPDALRPDFAPVDERLASDLILYAREYARLLVYYDTENRPAGTWSALLNGDVSVLAALLYKSIDPVAEKAAFTSHVNQLRALSGGNLQAALNDLLTAMAPKASRLLEWQKIVAPGLSLRAELDRLVPSVAFPALSQLLAYLRAARNQGFLDAAVDVDLLEATWPSDDFLVGFEPLISLTQAGPAAIEQEIVQLTGIFRALHQVMSAVASKAPRFLEETLTTFPEHEPHIALFLAFVQLMAYPREQLNSLTGRHLDFYYREVLKLHNFPEVPDQVHLVMELAQGFANGLITPETRTIDGKDDLGMDVYFVPDEELVVNGAKIDPENGLKSLYLTHTQEASNNQLNGPIEILNLFAAPVANDPAANAPTTDGKWSPLGSELAPTGRVGFVVASPMLLLGEGERTVDICFHLENFGSVLDTYGLSTVRSELETNVQVYLSGEKAWVEVKLKSVSITQLIAAKENTGVAATYGLKYTLSLGPEDPAIVPYHAKLIGQKPVPDALTATYPVACFLLDNFGISVLKDLDLSLSGDLSQKTFDANRRYLEGEITVSNNTTTGTFEIFESKGQSIGIGKTSFALVWEEVSQSLSSPKDWGDALQLGDFVEYAGKTFRANVALPQNLANNPVDHPGELMIWKELEGSQGVFDPEKKYLTGALVQEETTVYLAQDEIKAIAPNQAPDVWKAIPNGESLASFTQSTSRYYAFDGIVFQLMVVQTAEKPLTSGGGNLQKKVWGELPDVKLAPQPLYSLSEQVYESSLDKLFVLKNDENTLPRSTSRPPVLSGNPVWDTILPFNAATAYGPPPGINHQSHATLGSTVFQAQFLFVQETIVNANATNGFLLEPGKTVNGQPVKAWMLLEAYTVKPYNKGSYVFITQIIAAPFNIRTTRFYFATDEIPITDQPDIANSKWKFLGDDGLFSSFSTPWTAGRAFQAGNIANISNKFYAATFTHINIDPNGGANTVLWNAVPKVTYDLTTTYPEGAVVDFNGKLHFNRYQSLNIPPDQSEPTDIWQNLTTYKGLYALTTPYLKNQITRYTNGIFYQAATDNTGLDPSSDATIWEKKVINGAYSPIVKYGPDALVNWKGKNYYSTIAPDCFAPSVTPGNGNNWTQLGQGGPFSETETYDPGRVVVFNNVFYYAQFRNAETHPALGLAALEAVPATIPLFVAGQFYPIGSYVSAGNASGQDTGSIFRAHTDTQVADPAEGFRVWEKNSISIKPYQFSSQFFAGDYVEDKSSLYRLLTNEPSGEPSLISADWQPVGTIREHNPNIKWYANMHARDVKGNVFRAKSDLPANKSLSDSDENGEALWEQVSGSYPYKYLLPAQLTRMDVEVSVKNMRNLLLENDQGVVSASKPFHPFGTSPVVNSRFYIGSHEIFSKSPASVTLHATWGNLPEETGSQQGFETLYANYGLTVKPTNSSFSVNGFLLEENNWSALANFTDELLFVNEGNTSLVSEKEWSITSEGGLFKRNPELETFSALRANLQRGFLALQLNQDFYHQEFPNALATAAINKKPLPASPYSPLINAFSIDYTSKESLLFKDKTKGDLAGLYEQFFYLYPFGWADFLPVDTSLDDGKATLSSEHLVPVWNGHEGDANGNPVVKFNEEGLPIRVEKTALGNLFIGLSGVKAPQLLTLLIQVAESSENPDRNKQLVSWFYLTENRWKAFAPEGVVSDDTNGLLRPGIIKLSLPSDISSLNTQMPSGLCWIRASVTGFPDGVGKVYSIQAQAVKATFQNNGNDLTRLATALSPESVNKLEFSDAAIKSVSQPYASFGGKVVESSNDFYTRISERLRHKNRAINIFDYERLVLGQFPEVYQVKCISHTRPLVKSETTDKQLAHGLEYSPGYVQVIVLPDLRNQNAIDPLRPRVSKNTLVGIQDYLRHLNSSFSRLTVDNAVFEEVTVRTRVALLPGKDAGFYLRQLNEDLIRYLSPWRFDSEFDLHFGAELHISPLINYLDQLGYVDYVENVSMSLSLRDENGDTQVLTQNQEEVSAQTSASVLISAPQHVLELIENTDRCPNPLS